MQRHMNDELTPYITKMYCYYKYLNFSDYDLLNMIDNLLENHYSKVYQARNQIDEFHLVKFIKTSDGPIAYTYCHAHNVAVNRFKDVLVPLSTAFLGAKRTLNKNLLESILDTNTKVAPSELRCLLEKW